LVIQQIWMKNFVRHFSKELVPLKSEKPKKWDVIRYKTKRKTNKLPSKNSKMTKTELAKTSNFSMKDYERDPIPFISPKKIEALKKGDILPKEVQDNLIVERTKHGIDIYPIDDPHWLNLTSQLLSPMVRTMDDKKKELIIHSPDINEFFSTQDVNVENFNLLIKVQGAHGVCPSESYKMMKKWNIRPNEGENEKM
jgi:hypothetical protein